MSKLAAPPVGAILAGGAGRRIGGAKALVELRGKPLIYYPLEALQQAVADVVVVAKPTTELPSLPGATVWLEPDEPSHPLVGILHALSVAGGRAVLVCAGDLPFVSGETLSHLLAADPEGAPAVIAASGEITQPLLGCYQPAALELLRDHELEGPVQDALARIGARRLEVAPDVLFNVNYPEDLLHAAALLDASGRG